MSLARMGLAVSLAVVACTDVPVAVETDLDPAFARGAPVDPAAQIANIMDAVNISLAADGADYRVATAEYITSGESGEIGNTVIVRDIGNKQLDTDFVPGDARRAWSAGGGNAITYAIDQTGDAVPLFGGLGAAATDAAIVSAMNTWDALTCSNLSLTRNPDDGLDIGIVAFLVGLGGSPFVFADVQHAGWEIDFGGGVLGVTFTFIFISGGVPTDIDSNGKADTALREIYYDLSHSWADDGVTNTDVESVALHEAGHGLSQEHFGTVAIKNDGSLTRVPFAVMNAVYTGPLTTLLGTDQGGHCSNWSGWPIT